MTTYPGRMDVTLKDETGALTTSYLYLTADSAATGGDQLAEMTTIGGLIDAVVSTQIVQIWYGYLMDTDPSWKSAPAAGSLIGNCGSFRFSVEDALRTDTLDLFGINMDKVANGRVNTSDPDVSALVAHLLDGSGPYVYTGAKGQPLVALEKAWWSLRKLGGRRAG
jgi:hypothetical protein